MVRQILRLWALSLMLSVLLVAAGERWPQALLPDARVVAALVLGPPLVVLVWLVRNWRLDNADQGGSGERGESQDPEAMNP
jgi:hypothetical protein